LKVKLTGKEKDIEMVRFDKELFTAATSDTAAIVALSNKYPAFFDLYTYRVIQIGGLGDTLFFEGLQHFMNDTMIIDIRQKTDSVFDETADIEKELNDAFKYFQYHFPEKELPTIYFYISGFNQSVVTAEKIIGVSLDKYLGRDCRWYQQLNSTPQYKIANMHKLKIPSDVAYAWGVTEFESSGKTTTLLDNMIYQGKLMYFVDALLPETHDSLKIGYTALQLDWCKKNEAQMWSQLIEHKMLYSNNRMDIIRYTNPSPTTSGFPLESPGRTGVWIGWQIVREYMKKNQETTLGELMKNNDYQQILNDSKYFPE
jgi:hypothetical protein